MDTTQREHPAEYPSDQAVYEAGEPVSGEPNAETLLTPESIAKLVAGATDQLKTSLTSLQREMTDLSGVVSSLAESAAKLNNWAGQEVVRKFQEHKAIMETMDKRIDKLARITGAIKGMAQHTHKEDGTALVPFDWALQALRGQE